MELLLEEIFTAKSWHKDNLKMQDFDFLVCTLPKSWDYDSSFFFQCQYSKQIWQVVGLGLSWKEVLFAIPDDILTLAQKFTSFFEKSKILFKLYRTVFCAILYHIWQRNARIFKGESILKLERMCIIISICKDKENPEGESLKPSQRDFQVMGMKIVPSL